MKRYAVLSMDIEEWYHLDYFKKSQCDTALSVLDGIQVYRDLLARHGICSSYFVLGELVDKIGSLLKELSDEGNDIGSHGLSHKRPMTMSNDAFRKELKQSKVLIEDAIQQSVEGFRAPCFSMDRQRLDCVRDTGYLYDSSRILFGDHPLYGTLNMDGYNQISSSIFQTDDFFEFQVSTLNVLGKEVPVSGGGYLRIFPWLVMKRLLRGYLGENELFVLYIHPFELTAKALPSPPPRTSLKTQVRYRLGQNSVETKLEALIQLLKQNEYEFTTFSELRQRLVVEK